LAKNCPFLVFQNTTLCPKKVGKSILKFLENYYTFGDMCDSKKKYKLQDISSGFIVCVDCDERKPLDNYYFNKMGYYVYRCKDCHRKRYNQSRGLPLDKNKHKPTINENGKKVCKTCGEEKDLCEFNKIKDKYYSYDCFTCLYSKYSKHPKKEKKPKVINEERELFKKGFKKCKTCEQVLPFEKFPRKNYVALRKGDCTSCKLAKKYGKPEYREYQRKYQCSDEYLEYHKKWRNSEKGKTSLRKTQKKRYDKQKEDRRLIREEKNRQKEILQQERLKKRIERESLWAIKRQERLKKKLEWEKQQEHYKTDEWKKLKKERESAKRYERWKRRWNNDELFAMKVRIRNLVRNTFRKSGHTKPEKRTEEILGCNYDSLKLHLESQFVEGMSWDNRGEWHIDHKIPLATANTVEELIKLSHYTNLQPLWGEDNIRKGCKIL
jgi:hypothetical protein